MTEHDYSKTRKAAVDALIYWAKTAAFLVLLDKSF
jgi:hypothetical protein